MGYYVKEFMEFWQFEGEPTLSGSSFDDHDAQFYLGEEIIEALPEDAFEPYKEE